MGAPATFAHRDLAEKGVALAQRRENRVACKVLRHIDDALLFRPSR